MYTDIVGTHQITGGYSGIDELGDLLRELVYGTEHLTGFAEGFGIMPHALRQVRPQSEIAEDGFDISRPNLGFHQTGERMNADLRNRLRRELISVLPELKNLALNIRAESGRSDDEILLFGRPVFGGLSYV